MFCLTFFIFLLFPIEAKILFRVSDHLMSAFCRQFGRCLSVCGLKFGIGSCAVYAFNESTCMMISGVCHFHFGNLLEEVFGRTRQRNLTSVCIHLFSFSSVFYKTQIHLRLHIIYISYFLIKTKSYFVSRLIQSKKKVALHFTYVWYIHMYIGLIVLFTYRYVLLFLYQFNMENQY